MSSDDIKQITSQLDQIASALNAQNSILQEHVRCIEGLQQDLMLLRESHVSHGTELARLAKLVNEALHPRAPALTPVPALPSNLVRGEQP